MTKALYYLNETGEDYRAKIDAVTPNCVREGMEFILKGKLTLVAEGGEVSSIPSYDKVSQLIN